MYIIYACIYVYVYIIYVYNTHTYLYDEERHRRSRRIEKKGSGPSVPFSSKACKCSGPPSVQAQAEHMFELSPPCIYSSLKQDSLISVCLSGSAWGIV